MTRYKAPTIAEYGGLEPWLTHLGVNYGLFKQLRALDGQTNTSIAKALSKGRERPIQPSTVKGWIAVDDKEQENA